MKTEANRRELLRRLFQLFTRVQRHWAAVNARLPPDRPLILLSATERDRFSQLRQELTAAEDAVDRAILERELAIEALRLRKEALHPRLDWWRCNLTAFAPTSGWLAARPPLPQRASSVWRYRPALVIMRYVWSRLAALDPPLPEVPLVAPDGFTRADLEAAWEALWAAEEALVEAELEETLARAERALLYQEATALLMAYGHAVRSRLPPGDALRQALPPLWPRRRKAPAPGPVDTAAGPGGGASFHPEIGPQRGSR